MEKYPWVAFYKELAEKLSSYGNNRQELVRKVYQIYNETGLNMPKLDTDGQLLDIDPFTFYGLFNKGLSNANRALIAKAIANLLGMQSTPPDTFNGIPVLNLQNATFYNFIGDRSENDIDKLWDFFEAALKYSHTKSDESKAELSALFDWALSLKGNASGKITMGLFWIAPDVFINFDSRNRWYIYESGQIPANVVAALPSANNEGFNAKTYFEITRIMFEYLANSPFETFVDLSEEAWRYSEQINKEKRAASKTKEDGVGDDETRATRYWIYSPGANAEKWEEYYQAGIMAVGWGRIGDLKNYNDTEGIAKALHEEYNVEGSLKNIKLCAWQFAHAMKPGDIVFVKKGMHEIVGRGVVESDYYYDEATNDDFSNRRKVKWTHKGSWQHRGKAVVKTLTDITDYTDYVDWFNSLFSDGIDVDPPEETSKADAYSADDFLEDVYIDSTIYETIVELLNAKKNLILQGAPGVGKTYAAKRLAYSIMREKNSDRVCLIQFHQSYSYEDFIEGFRPAKDTNGFEIKKGVFYNFCEKAKQDPENAYFFIIDEINRGNLSKIFGELFMLIESDKRSVPIQLLYSDEKFRVPENLYIIGMMNTADRSLALLDYALRRRFAFFEMEPAFDSDGFIKYRNQLASIKFDRLVDAVKQLNQIITEDESLGRGFRIGHSYFCNLAPDAISDRKLQNIVEYELLPLLKEYWFDSNDAYERAENLLRSALR